MLEKAQILRFADFGEDVTCYNKIVYVKGVLILL